MIIWLTVAFLCHAVQPDSATVGELGTLTVSDPFTTGLITFKSLSSYENCLTACGTGELPAADELPLQIFGFIRLQWADIVLFVPEAAEVDMLATDNVAYNMSMGTIDKYVKLMISFKWRAQGPAAQAFKTPSGLSSLTARARMTFL